MSKNKDNNKDSQQRRTLKSSPSPKEEDDTLAQEAMQQFINGIMMSKEKTHNRGGTTSSHASLNTPSQSAYSTTSLNEGRNDKLKCFGAIVMSLKQESEKQETSSF